MELLARDLRASPRYELVLFDRLSPAERDALGGLAKDPDFYGILRPRQPSPGLGVKSADRETALLFLTLREPGPLPAYVRSFGEAALRSVERLVADGVLEVASGDGFVSGAAALGLLPEAERAGAVQGRLAELSVAALRHAEALAVDDPLDLAAWLYGYNRRPLTPRWRRLLSSAEAVQAYLGLGPGGPNRRALDRAWSARPPAPGWIHWVLRSRSGADSSSESAPTYKLYVSPSPEALAESFGPVLEALTAARPFQFKVGADAWGLLRPDKVVAYFPSFERLAEAAAAIADRLAGVAGLPVQGVPFTAEIAGDGLVSWGIDPPEAERPLATGRESWRFWLVQRLARALLAARAEAAPEPWRFALERIRLEGIDTATWTPGALLWKES